MRDSPKMQNMLCQTWYEMRASLPAGEAREQAYERLAQEIPCNFP